MRSVSPSIKLFATLLLGLGVFVALGPRAGLSDEGVLPVSPDWDIAPWVARNEAGVGGIRPGDGKEIVWADREAPGHTELSLVYLHGFSADRHEISPTMERLASALGANLFFTRLAGHGQDGAALGAVTAEAWLQDTEEALSVGSRLGSRVVLVGTSTGGTLALWAAAQERWKDRLAAVVLISPNFGPRDQKANLLLWPWGGTLARMVVGAERCFEPVNDAQARHWTTCYPTRGLLPMMALVHHVREMDLSRITAPVLVLYSPEDQVVDAQATERILGRLQSPPVQMAPVSEADDPFHHVLAGDILSPGTTGAIVDRILSFLER